jgi:hypothetical protein
MAQKISRARRKAMGISLTPREGCWIKYQLDLCNITYKMVAAKAGLSENMVSHFLASRKNSERIKMALTEILGYASFEDLKAASRGKEAAA